MVSKMFAMIRNGFLLFKMISNPLNWISARLNLRGYRRGGSLCDICSLFRDEGCAISVNHSFKVTRSSLSRLVLFAASPMFGLPFEGTLPQYVDDGRADPDGDDDAPAGMWRRYYRKSKPEKAPAKLGSMRRIWRNAKALGHFSDPNELSGRMPPHAARVAAWERAAENKKQRRKEHSARLQAKRARVAAGHAVDDGGTSSSDDGSSSCTSSSSSST